MTMTRAWLRSLAPCPSADIVRRHAADWDLTPLEQTDD